MTPAEGMLGALQGSALSVAMRSSLWLYPAVEIVHITGFALLVGSVVMFDLRLLGLSKTVPVRALARHLLPWSVGSLLLIVPSGFALFTAHASDFISNTAFVTKMGLLMLAGANAAAFHAGVFQSAAGWDTGTRAPVAARLHAAASIVIWVAVIACGRLLAYV